MSTEFRGENLVILYVILYRVFRITSMTAKAYITKRPRATKLLKMKFLCPSDMHITLRMHANCLWPNKKEPCMTNWKNGSFGKLR